MIESARNQLVKDMRSLHAQKGRAELGLFLIEGEKLARDALEAGWPIAHCFHLPGRFEELAARARDAGAQVAQVSRAVMDALCDTKTPQGILLAGRLPDASAVGIILDRGKLLALDGVQDPGNVGTLLRTAEATGFAAAALGAGCADPFSPKVVRGSMGSVFRLPILHGLDLADFLTQMRDAGFSCAATAMRGEDFFSRGPMPPRRALVIGSEGRGLSDRVLAACDRRLTLPMAGGAQSLNAAIAAAIMMYDWFREDLG